ncbi:hypothetical protein OAF92_01220 [bacterium]|nr:hypothetical protein [bacterium]
MSGYIGTQPVPQATQTRDSFTATSGQTSFATGGYTPNFLDVYLNGVKLASADYTATNGSDVVLASGAATGDILEVVAYTAFDTANVTGATNFTVTGAFTSQGIDDNGNATALTIDSSENVLIGKTSQSVDTVGAELLPSGIGQFTVDGNFAGRFTRKTSDGDIIVLRKGTGTVGSIGTKSGSLLIGSTDTYLRINDPSDTIFPSDSAGTERDNLINLGKGSSRFKDAYLSGGVYLGGTGSANHLRHYESGSWTPSFEGDTTAGTYTYVERQGHYVRVGNQVTAWVNLTNITTGSAGSGRIAITGLPYAANWMSGFNGESVGVIGLHGFVGINGTYIMPIIQDGLNKIFLYNFQGSSNNSDVINVTDKSSNGSDIRGYVTYYIGG